MTPGLIVTNDFVPFSPVALVVFAFEEDEVDDGEDESECNIHENETVAKRIPRRVSGAVLNGRRVNRRKE